VERLRLSTGECVGRRKLFYIQMMDDAATGPPETQRGSAPVFTADDDNTHRHLAADDWWFTETAWFSWHHAERKLGGWFYTMLRPNIGTVAGGAWVWDDSAHLPWEVPYSVNHSALEMPVDADLRNVELPTGVSLEVLEPTMDYRLGFDDPGKFTADLRFAGVMAPRPLASVGSTFGSAAHFDQIGRVTGTVEINGESIDIDCHSVRDRTWGRRPENRPRQAAYVTGAGDNGAGFLAVTNTRDGTDGIAYGFVNRGSAGSGSVAVDIIEGERKVIRNPDNGWIEEIVMEGVDANGVPFAARGRSVSRIIINRHTFIDVNSLVHWTLDGPGFAPNTEWWGEDQDMWPMTSWSAAKRSGDWSIPIREKRR
jgi:hypothetical protein